MAGADYSRLPPSELPSIPLHKRPQEGPSSDFTTKTRQLSVQVPLKDRSVTNLTHGGPKSAPPLGEPLQKALPVRKLRSEPVRATPAKTSAEDVRHVAG